MENEKIFYFDGISARSTNVRVLVFNDLVNLYDDVSGEFIASYPLKGTWIVKTGENYFIYFNSAGTCYVQLHHENEAAKLLLDEVGKANHGWTRKLMSQKIIVLLGMAVVLFVGIYFLLITMIPYLGAAMISREVEVKMGDKLKQVLLSEDRVTGATVDSAGSKKLQAFADAVHLSDHYQLHVTLVNSPIVNAYALPGGQIVVYSGMLEKISDPESLVALLAHEASHVNQRHSLRSLLRSTANAILVSVIFNDPSGITTTIVGNAQTLNGLDYSRSAETEADEYGMQLMLANNIDVAGMKRLMQLLQKQGDVPASLSFLSSHPLTIKRIKAAERFIKQHPQNQKVNDRLKTLFKKLPAKK